MGLVPHACSKRVVQVGSFITLIVLYIAQSMIFVLLRHSKSIVVFRIKINHVEMVVRLFLCLMCVRKHLVICYLKNMDSCLSIEHLCICTAAWLSICYTF
jgi:hypothetical protein